MDACTVIDCGDLPPEAVEALIEHMVREDEASAQKWKRRAEEAVRNMATSIENVQRLEAKLQEMRDIRAAMWEQACLSQAIMTGRALPPNYRQIRTQA